MLQVVKRFVIFPTTRDRERTRRLIVNLSWHTLLSAVSHQLIIFQCFSVRTYNNTYTLLHVTRMLSRKSLQDRLKSESTCEIANGQSRSAEIRRANIKSDVSFLNPIVVLLFFFLPKAIKEQPVSLLLALSTFRSIVDIPRIWKARLPKMHAPHYKEQYFTVRPSSSAGVGLG